MMDVMSFGMRIIGEMMTSANPTVTPNLMK